MHSYHAEAAKGATRLTINALTFERLPKVIENPSKSQHGFFKVKPSGISLFKQDGSLEAFIVNNSRQGRFIVSAAVHDGKPWYCQGLSCLTQQWLGLEWNAEEKAIRNMVFSQ